MIKKYIQFRVIYSEYLSIKLFCIKYLYYTLLKMLLYMQRINKIYILKSKVCEIQLNLLDRKQNIKLD